MDKFLEAHNLLRMIQEEIEKFKEINNDESA